MLSDVPLCKYALNMRFTWRNFVFSPKKDDNRLDNITYES